MSGVIVTSYDSFEIIVFALLAVSVVGVVWGLSYLAGFLLVRLERACGAGHRDRFRK